MKLRDIVCVAIVLTCALAAETAGQTVRERLRDPAERAYSVIFGVVIDRDLAVQVFRVAKVVDPKSESARAVAVDVPEEYVRAARRKVEANGYSPQLEDGEPTEFFIYFYYLPGQPSIVVTDLDRPLDQQP
jgi:hypothetical protein